MTCPEGQHIHAVWVILNPEQWAEEGPDMVYGALDTSITALGCTRITDPSLQVTQVEGTLLSDDDEDPMVTFVAAPAERATHVYVSAEAYTVPDPAHDKRERT